ncbi:MAG: MotA/TolQ/ExbB proton channel family protein [Planctomycetes bacterium]|nr:MotA/TolQ/ExbB proton channel family protein [Planctomycetota bacterium]
MKMLPSSKLRMGRLVLMALLAGGLAWAASGLAQNAAPPVPPKDKAEAKSSSEIDEALNAAAKSDAPAAAPADDEKKSSSYLTTGRGLFDLIIIKGGPLMIPIYIHGFLSIVFAIERYLALRKSRVVPTGLVDEIGVMVRSRSVLDPREVYRVCQKYPSTASTVVRDMLLKIGRPHAEVEQAVTQSKEREAAKLYKNVRWLNLSTYVAPLWGLYGTVWGMIVAFYETANLRPDQNKTEALASGVYIALVTTLAGLFVAIPSATVAHHLEDIIQDRFREIDELLSVLLPLVECYEGRQRISHGQLDEETAQQAKRETKPVLAQPVGRTT